METRPEPSPEGRLIDDARAAAGLSVREAARRTGISNTRWNQIRDGSHAPAKTIAKMARVAGVTPGQLETEGRRPDAAAVLAGLLAEDDELTLPGVPPAAASDVMALRIGETIRAEMHKLAASIELEVATARAAGRAEDRIFADETEAALWAIPLMSEEDRILRIAWVRARPPAGPARRNSPPATLAGLAALGGCATTEGTARPGGPFRSRPDMKTCSRPRQVFRHVRTGTQRARSGRGWEPCWMSSMATTTTMAGRRSGGCGTG